MSFFEAITNRSTEFRKAKYLTFTLGTHVTRLLGKPRSLYIHWLNSQRLTIDCLGDECPICKNNRKLMMENPDTYKKESGWIPRQPRYLINVLDKTLGVVCPNSECGAENKRGLSGNPQVCWKCEAILSGEKVKPLNTIKILGIGSNNMELLETFDITNTDADGNRYGLNNFDILWTVTKNQSSGKKVISPSISGLDGNKDPVSYNEDDLFDLNDITLKLSEDEIRELLRGVSLRDIFLARSKPKSEESDSTSEIDEAIGNLFNQ